VTQLWPYIVIGLFSGSVYALASMGLVLTYKTSGIFNFAYGAVAMFCGFTFWQLRDGWGISQWLSLPILLLVVAPVLGLVAERVFRPVTALSAEIQLVIAFGILGTLQALARILYGPQDRSLTSIFPTSTFSLGSSLNVSYTQLFTLLMAAALGLGLYLMLRKTRFGLATQAVVDNRDLSALIGVSSVTISRAAWIISTVFAGLVGILLSSSQGLDVYTLFLVVTAAFAPAVFGKLVSLPLAFGGAMVLGVAQSILAKYGSAGTVADLETALPYIVLFLLLVIYGNRLKEVRSSIKTVTTAVPTAGRAKLTGLGSALLAVGIFLPWLFHGSVLRDASAGLVFAAIALTLVVLNGWAGQPSLCQFTFVGVGALTVGHMVSGGGNAFVPAALLGAAIAVPLGIIVGLPSLRLSPLFLALATLAFALVMDDVVFVRRDLSGGLTGLNVGNPSLFGFRFDTTIRFYYLAFGLFALYALVATLLRRGPIGRRLQMMRDAPLGASTFGVNLTVTKLAVFAGCGAAAAFAGAFYGALRGTVNPSDFAFAASLELLLLVVLGGRSLVAGALIAGSTYMFELLPISAGIEKYVPLLVSIGVVLLAQYPDGPIQVANERMRVFSALFRPRPRLEPTTVNGSVPEDGTAIATGAGGLRAREVADVH
jgi:branched-chain amino acid transport system permease protein